MSKKYSYFVPWSERILFLKLFVRWKKSIWQLIGIDLLVYLGLYAALSLLYRLVLSKDNYHKENFELVVQYVKEIENTVPLSFLLGFYVSAIIGRWWSVCMLIPLMNHSAYMIQYLIPTDPENAKACHLLRLTILRYMNLGIALSLRDMSEQFQKRFALNSHNVACKLRKDIIKKMKKVFTRKDPLTPSLRTKLEKFNEDEEVKKTFGKLITEEEICVFQTISQTQEAAYEPEFWIPLQWAGRVLQKAHQLGMISHMRQYIQLVKMLDNMRGCLSSLRLHIEFNIPLVYTQVVIIAVYSYFLGELFARQFVDDPLETEKVAHGKVDEQREFDSYLPIFTIFKFVFYMGWFKLGYTLLNPLGMDAENIPVSDFFTKNLQVSVRSGTAPDDLYPSFLQDSSDQLRTLDDVAEVFKELEPESEKEINDLLEEENNLEEIADGATELEEVKPLKKDAHIA